MAFSSVLSLRKFHHIFILVFLFWGVNPSQGQVNNLKGKVKSYRQTDYEIANKSGEPEKGKKLIDDFNYYDTFISFDVNGKQIEFSGYNLDGNIKSGTFTKTDLNGTIIETINLMSDGSIDTMKYRFDNMGNRIEYNQAGITTSEEIFRFGQKVESIRYDGEGKILIRTIYDVKGNRTEIRFYNPGNGSLFCKTKYNYDKKGNCVESFKNDGRYRTTYKYDKHGNETESIIHDDDGSTKVCTSIYTLDSHGNWVRRIQSSNGQPNLWTERIIEYYE